jgi:SAM-dependent methyltransferase
MPYLHEDTLQHRAWLLSWIEVPADGVVVDLGCGAGEDMLALATRFSNVPVSLIGLDSSAQSVSAAQAEAGDDRRLRFQEHYMRDPLPFGNASADVVYLSNLLECLPDPAALVREIARILRPDGQLVIGHWDWDSQVFDGAEKPLVRGLVHAFAGWQQGWMEHVDGWMGRRLWGIINSSGHFAGSVQARVLINTHYSAPWFGFTNAQAFRSLVKRGLASAEDVEKFEQEQIALDQQGRYFYSITGYAYIGKRTRSA